VGLPGGVWKRVSARLNERNLGILLLVSFIGISAWIASVPYDAMKMDLADATTNDIWSGLIHEGKYAIPIEEWRARGYPPTQSSVVELDGKAFVVNEKGPGHAMLVAALDTVGLGGLTGTLCCGLAVLGTYMLGRRLFNWKVGFLAAIFVMTNLTVIVMWHRYLWTDASTMHFLVLVAWLLAESLHLFRRGDEEARKELALGGSALGILGGLAFGLSISTRYPVALVLGPLLLFILAFHAYRAKGFRRAPRKLLSWMAHSAKTAMPFILGLLIVMVPLMQYNSTYFGGPLRSGYDAVSLVDYSRTGDLTERNQSVQWSAGWADGAANVWSNGMILTPILLARMPLLLLVPFSLVMLRRRPQFWLLVPWAVVVFVTYLSISWVKMYSNALNIVWEPRYFMPALPALAILAAFALDDISLNDRSDGRKVLFAATLAAGIVMAGMIPAEAHFKELREGNYFTPGGPRGPGQPGNNGQDQPGQPDTQFQKVALPDLLSKPLSYAQKFVQLENLTVLDAEFPTVNLTDGNLQVSVHLDNFTSLPDVARIGQKVNARGPWSGIDRNGNGKADPGEFFLNVKYGTADLIEVAG
jgi:hypothetical protein